MKKKLVLFDLDGVLLDSKKNMELSWLEVCRKHGVKVDFSDYFSKIGRPFADILSLLSIDQNQVDIEETFNKKSTQLIHELTFYDGVKASLNQLSSLGIKTGIVTSKNTLKTQKILALLDFSFDIVQTPNNTLEGKPAPDHLLYAMSELNASPLETLYIGDMDVDCEAAKRAGVDYVHAKWGYGVCNDENIIKLSDISNLVRLIST